MNESETKKRREWIKNIAIVFLAVLLVLTLFSNTILNHSLPEVAVQYTTSDNVSNGIRVSAAVSASKTYNIVAEETRTIRNVLVRNGDEVAAGDVLVEFEAEESDELKDARKQLQSLKADYDRAVLGQQSGDTSSQAQTVKRAETELARAEKNLASFKQSMASTEEQKAIDNAMRVVESLKKWHGDAYTELPGVNNERAIDYFAAYVGVAERDVLFQTETVLPDAPESAPENPAVIAQDSQSGSGSSSDSGSSSSSESSADSSSDTAGPSEPDSVPTPEPTVRVKGYAFADLKPEYTGYYAMVLATAQADLEKAEWQLSQALAVYQDAVTGAKANLEEARKALSSQQSSNSTQAQLNKLDLDEKKRAVAEQEQLVAELAARAGQSALTARQGGMVTELNIAAGDKISAGTTACVIQLTDTGYTAEVSVPNAQAARVRVGSPATVSGYYWGDPPRATVAGIRTDPTTKGNRIITLNLTGSVESGISYNFTLGETQAMYDVVVPKNAVREDNTGKFVLIVTNKSTPLGTRYYATRVDVSVLASDDTRCAVSGDFTGWDYVITSSSAPLSTGDQVRLADA